MIYFDLMQSASCILQVRPLGFPWPTIDPFLFCVHHTDSYPPGNRQFGPATSLAGRPLGQDFTGKDGWRMYHGQAVPGFPAHPHRGFETVTVVRQGLIDHADSLGAAARFGRGDVQWLTAGHGIVHAEMFPLLQTDAPNPLELFQIWLNLPALSKMAEPRFTMFWAEDIPRRVFTDAHGRATEVTCIAGPLAGTAAALRPPPASWAAQADADVALWTLAMAPGAHWTLPPANGAATRRMLYFFQGATLALDGQPVQRSHAIELRGDRPINLANGDTTSELLLLQGRPIGEPVAQYGPFVMNTQEELQQAFADYRSTEFGGWPWPDQAPVHGAAVRRFAQHADRRIETRPAATPQPWHSSPKA
jgi:redox-sensitive bicupin YhaK (pirin superfamily)